MTEEQIAYFAGLFDGEGSVSILLTRRGDWKLCCRISNTNREVLQTAKDSFKVGQIGGRNRGGNRKPDFWWHVVGKQAEGFLRAVLPFLVIKKDRAVLALLFRDSINNHHYGLDLTLEEIAFRCKLKERMEVLS